MLDRPNLDIVAKLYHLDPDTFLLGPDGTRRWDGTPATPDEVEAVRNARVADFKAVVEFQQLALEQSEWELVRKERIKLLCDKYRRDGDTGSTPLSVIETRMSPEDRAEWIRLWDDLGNVMVLTGGAQ
jgi:hypothetical protein